MKQEFCFGPVYFFVYYVTQPVRCWFFTAEPQVQSWVTYEIPSGTGAGLFSEFKVFPAKHNFTIAPYPSVTSKTCDCLGLGLGLAGFGVRMLVTFLGFPSFDVAGASTRCGQVY